jgi:hypothetical protein
MLLNRFCQALWFALPVIIGGLLHVGVIKLNWLPALARHPLDGGATLRGRRLLGDNKTVRGAVVMIGATLSSAALLGHAAPSMARRLAVASFQVEYPAFWGFLLGAGYIIGELPNSLIKRQFDIAPGESACGRARFITWTVDQVDSVVGGFLLLALVWRPDWIFVALILGLSLLLHPLVAALMVALKLKARIG